jgi:hypothetical protein
MLEEMMGSSSAINEVSDAVRAMSDRVDAIPFCGRKRKSSNVLPIQVVSTFYSPIAKISVLKWCCLGTESIVSTAIVSKLAPAHHTNKFS